MLPTSLASGRVRGQGSQLMGQALGHAWVPEGLHKDLRDSIFSSPSWMVLFQLRNLTAQVVEHSCEGRAEGWETSHDKGM